MTALIDKLEHRGARNVCAEHGNKPDALLEILHEIQDIDGYLSDEALRTTADALNISRAEIHGVVSFYHDYHREPTGKHAVKICRAEACQAVGSEALAAHAERRLKVKTGETTGDKQISLQAVYCLGNCALGPAVMIDDDLFGKVTPERFENLVTALSDEALS